MKQIFLNILLLFAVFLIVFGAILYATSPEVWYAGDPNYEILVKEAQNPTKQCLNKQKHAKSAVLFDI